MNRDLEFIVSCLELGAITLTNKPGEVFIVEALLAKATEYGCGDLDEADAKIVLSTARFVTRVPGGMVLR